MGTLKSLQTLLKTAEGEVAILKLKISSLNKELTNKTNSVNILKDKIKTYNVGNDVKVTEHAMLRYLERVKGINLAEIEGELVTSKIKTQVEKLGDGTYPTENGFRVTIKNNMVVTVTC